jgi:hypothetical protein
MAMHPVIDNLDRCTMALQSLAEGQSSSLTVVLELLLEQLEDAMGQAAAQLRPCTCQGTTQPRVASGAAARGLRTLRPRSRQTPASWAPEDAEAEPLSSRTVGVRACAPGSGWPSGSSPAGRLLAPAARYAILPPRVAMQGYRKQLLENLSRKGFVPIRGEAHRVRELCISVVLYSGGPSYADPQTPVF